MKREKEIKDEIDVGVGDKKENDIERGEQEKENE